MARIELNVPFGEKDEAKALGARWDAHQRRWYVPDGVDPTPLSKWTARTTDAIAPNVRSKRFGIALSGTHCWKCHVQVSVACLVVGPYHQEREGDREEDWEAMDYASALSNVTYISPAALSFIQVAAPWFRKTYSRTVGGEYWGNVCVNCGALQGDFHLHNEPGGAFFPVDAAARARIDVQWVAAPLYASADLGIDNEWLG